jgi:hypothetical protein
MSAGSSQAESGTRGRTARNDGLHSFNGAGSGGGSFTETQGVSAGPGGTVTGNAGSVQKTSWFEPVDSGTEISDCPGGVCPVPWLPHPSRPDLQPDLVNHPPHYLDGGIECIEAIEAQLTPEEYRGYLKGNCVKYLWRERHKGNIESLKKAQWYMDRLITFDEVNQKG